MMFNLQGMTDLTGLKKKYGTYSGGTTNPAPNATATPASQPATQTTAPTSQPTQKLDGLWGSGSTRTQSMPSLTDLSKQSSLESIGAPATNGMSPTGGQKATTQVQPQRTTLQQPSQLQATSITSPQAAGSFDVDGYLSGLNNAQLADINLFGPDVPKGVDRGDVMSRAAALLRERSASGDNADTGGAGSRAGWSGLENKFYDGIMNGTYLDTQAEQLFRTNGTRLGFTADNIPAKYRDAWERANRGSGMQPDMNGMGSDGSQRNPLNTAPNDPNDPLSWQGSGTHDKDGNPIPKANEVMPESGNPVSGDGGGTTGGGSTAGGTSGGYPYNDPETGEPANANQGDGGTTFNPGGGTNPDGTNPTVPQGNTNNGTSPSVYQLLDQVRQSPAEVGDQEYAQFRQSISGNGTYYENMGPAGQARMLNTLHEGLRTGNIDWNDTNNQFGLREAYIEAFGDPMQGVTGAADNTVNADGSVQGQYQGDQGGAFQAVSSDSASMEDMDVERTDAAAAEQNQREQTEGELAASRTLDIMKQDSPLMMLAAQDGIDMANRAGLRNSSLAAGASQREMARQATPLAMQDAQTTAQMESQNQMLESDRLEQNAGRQQQNDQFNAANENAASSQEFQTEAQRRDANAGRQTETSITNASMANDMTQQERQLEMQYNLQQLAGDQDFAKQQLAGTLSQDLARVEGSYKQLISENDTAARLFDSYYQSVASVVGNDKIFADEASEKVNYLKGAMESSLQALLAFEDFELPSAGATGSGENSNFSGGDSNNQLPDDFNFGQFAV